MRLSELFEETSSEKERAFQDAWVAAQKTLRASGIPPARWGNIRSDAHTNMSNFGQDPDDAINSAIDAERNAVQAKRFKADQQPAPTKSAKPAPTRDKVRPTITKGDPDRTRKDALGRNLKADRYYNQLNKSQRGRDIIKKVSQKLGLPPEADEVIDYIADTMPTVIQKLDNIIANPANIGGALNPRNRRK